MGMIPGMDLATGGGDMDLGAKSSASDTGSTFGNVSGANVSGTVKDKSWLFGGGGQSSDKTGYYIGAAGVIAIAVVATVFLVKGRK